MSQLSPNPPARPHPPPVPASHHPDSRPGLSYGHMLVILGPLLGLGAFTALLAMVASLFGWYRPEMLVAAAGVGGTMTLVALVLLYRRSAEHLADQRALQNVEARVGGIVESAMDPIISINEGHRIVLFNAAAERVFLWPRSAMIGQSLDVLLPQRFREAHGRHIARFSETGDTSRRMGGVAVLMGLRANDEEFPIEASISQHSEDGRKLFTVIIRDVTERLRNEALLARSEARLRGILDSAMDAIITVDEQQRIVLFNTTAEKVFGCTKEEAIGAPLTWFIPERFRQGHEEHIRQFGETGTSSRRMGTTRIVTGLRRSGEEFPIDASISQITEHGSKFYTVILRDVTERVRAEEALRRSKDELRDLSLASNSVREQEKSRIARELHDELAQALTALKMDVAWLDEHLVAREPDIGSKLKTMQQLLDNTVAATRRISADLRPLILDDLGLVPAAEWLVQNFTQRSGIDCSFEVTPPELDLEDPQATALFRILQESLTNVSRHARASRVEVRIDGTDDSVTLSVRDNGGGFAPQTPRKPNSYGLLGLRERVYLLGGEVDIDSLPGKGTEITVHIPLTADAGARQQ